MKTLLAAVLLLPCLQDKNEEGFIQLFNGKDLTGWKANENDTTFKVEDGKIIANGNRCHLFYVGDVKNHLFKNFELRAQVYCKPVSNSGIYIHTEYQEKDWPSKGFECQICTNGFKDPRKTGSLYAVKDIPEAPAPDETWFDYTIIQEYPSQADGRLREKTQRHRRHRVREGSVFFYAPRRTRALRLWPRSYFWTWSAKTLRNFSILGPMTNLQ